MYSVGNMSSGHQPDLRNSLRFPLHLQVTLRTPTEEYHAKTIDISAGGILFHTDAIIHVDSPVEFTIEMPGSALGTDCPVLVKCRGRVVRSSEEAIGRTVAVAIDDYEFVRADLDLGATEYEKVVAHAVETFGSEINANAWLNRPNRVFHNQSPLQVLTQDPAAVEEELVRIDHGMFI
jgi:PilZ domain-containing protein/antitoxin Xre/MbcA/ParS-like protein